MYEDLRKAVCEANIELHKQDLVIYSWGNVSGIDRKAGVVAIKPSGVPYDEMTPEKIVLVDLEGKVVEGGLKPSSDTATHLELYKNFYAIGGICHAHSMSATIWAQAGREIPCFGTTHADYFYGPVPVTEPLTEDEIKEEYELNTGRIIVRRFAELNPMRMPAVLVAGHGPFTWGSSDKAAVETMVVLEEIATMAIDTLMINPNQPQISQALLDKHYFRKHGETAYYGQKDDSKEKM
ncbi:MAG: L-ribulose-5-phosphate 4-epimerase [Sedimentisphaerales bacterium]|nr:L-ribulose-5-phosphate 4-epimerase [Sedimentisphaerales bacterium]